MCCISDGIEKLSIRVLRSKLPECLFMNYHKIAKVGCTGCMWHEHESCMHMLADDFDRVLHPQQSTVGALRCGMCCRECVAAVQVFIR